MQGEIVRILYQLLNKEPITDGDWKMIEEWSLQSEHNCKLYEEVLDPKTFQQEVKTSLDYDSTLLWKKISRNLLVKKNRLISFGNSFIHYCRGIWNRI